MTDVVVIGGGHNGLVAAARFAKAGLSTLVLERTDRAGGCARTTAIAPGFKAPALAHWASIDPSIVRDLALERHGLRIVRGDAAVCASSSDEAALVIWRDASRAAREIAGRSARDGEQYPRFLESFSRISRVVRAICTAPPPSIDDPSAGDVIELVKAARAYRSIGKADEYRLLRWMPMPVADLVAEWFESELLRAAIAAGGVLGSFLGPWSAGSSALLLLLGAVDGDPFPGWAAEGGMTAVADALAAAARAAGATIRTGSAVAAIQVTDGSASGVVLEGGEEIRARTIVSNLDPKRTLLTLVGPMHLDPEFVRRMQNIRAHGTLAKVNYAVSTLPRLRGLAGLDANQQSAALSGRTRLAGSIDAIERAFDAAKYGRWSEEPWIELAIPSLLDPSLAPAGQHVVSAYVQYAPYQLRGTTWDAERDRFGDAATLTIDRHAPGFASSVIAREVVTPLDLERSYGLTGGHIFHGELALDQLFVTRPTLGWSRYATPIRNLYICGSGAHPGTGLNGLSGSLAAQEVLRRARR